MSKLVTLAAAAAVAVLAAAPAMSDGASSHRHHARHHHHARYQAFGRPYYNYDHVRKPYYAVSCNYGGWFSGWQTSCYGRDGDDWYWPR